MGRHNTARRVSQGARQDFPQLKPCLQQPDNTQNSFERYRITGYLLDNAKQSYDLAQARYQQNISSIVEFNQAELSLVAAEIAYADTRYEYLVRQSALSFQTGTLR